MSVTAATGFLAAGTACGIKADGSPDLAVVRASGPVPAAGVFTRSSTAAAPVELSRTHLSDGRAGAVVVNSGCANAGTGARGAADALATVAAAAARYRLDQRDILVCSTGPIGTRLPVDRLVAGLPEELGDSPDHGRAAARAIMTTDTVHKEAYLARDGYTIGGMAKGAGMIRPDMATMLAIVTTDALVEPADLQIALEDAAELSFNSLNIDGCQSTNDSVFLLASGESEARPEMKSFTAHLVELCRDLAAQIARDAEGAGRVVTLRIAGAADATSARAVGRHIADSALVRSSFYGADPNWGRILAAVGVGPVPVDAHHVDIAFAGVPVAVGGRAVELDDSELVAVLESGDFDVDVRIGRGPGQATILTTDLTPDYVRFNGERS